MRQQVLNAVGRVRRQPFQNIAQVGMRVQTIEFGRVHQAHDRRCTLTRTHRTHEQPIGPADRHRSDLLFEMIIVDCEPAVIHITNQGRPAFQAVVQGLGNARAIESSKPGTDPGFPDRDYEADYGQAA